MWTQPVLIAILAALILPLAACGKDNSHDSGDDANGEDMAVDLPGDQPDDGLEDVEEDLQPDGTDTADVPIDMARPEYTPETDPGRHNAEVIDTRQVIPGPGLPSEAQIGASNNNLDVIRHSDGRIYLAWRTAPSHFAGTETRIHVVSTDDEQSWQYETSFELATDLREPRFLTLPGGHLYLYMAELGTDELSFDPQGILVSELLDDGTWTDLESVYEPGYIPWRTKVIDGTPYMTAYVGGENIYKFNGEPLTIDLLTTDDGRTWTGVDPMDPAVSMGGGSETAFTIGDDGTLYAVVRNEAGDGFNFGSKICTAPPSDITDWSCVYDPKKYDSPLMFWYDGEAYLIARRNVTQDGYYDLGTVESGEPQGAAAVYQLDYTQQRKRCSLWRFDQDTQTIGFMLDFPSRGDTCFPGILAGDNPGEFIIYNYSSPLDGPDLVWNDGQNGDTNIYRHVLKLTAR